MLLPGEGRARKLVWSLLSIMKPWAGMNLAVRLRRCSDPEGGRHSSLIKGSHKLPSWNPRDRGKKNYIDCGALYGIHAAGTYTSQDRLSVLQHEKRKFIHEGGGDPGLQPCGSLIVDRSGAEAPLGPPSQPPRTMRINHLEGSGVRTFEQVLGGGGARNSPRSH